LTGPTKIINWFVGISFDPSRKVRERAQPSGVVNAMADIAHPGVGVVTAPKEGVWVYSLVDGLKEVDPVVIVISG